MSLNKKTKDKFKGALIEIIVGGYLIAMIIAMYMAFPIVIITVLVCIVLTELKDTRYLIDKYVFGDKK